jgi:hypothetical protein
VEAHYDPALGARPLRRTIEDLVVDPLAEMLIRGKIAETDTMLVGCRGGELAFRKKRAQGRSSGRRKAPPVASTVPPTRPGTELPADEDWTTRLML